MMKQNSFRDFILEQLRELEGLECRRMFSGYGLYQGSTFFAIVTSRGRLYFKTNPETAKRYIVRDMQPFRATATQTLKNYYEVPSDILDDRRELTSWAREAIHLSSSIL